MTREEHLQTVARYRAMRGKGTPSEYMAYMWSRQALGEPLSAAQRVFLAAAQKPHWHGQAMTVESTPAVLLPPKPPEAAPPGVHDTGQDFDEVPAWATEDAA